MAAARTRLHLAAPVLALVFAGVGAGVCLGTGAGVVYADGGAARVAPAPARVPAYGPVLDGFITRAHPAVVPYGHRTVISGTLVGPTGQPVAGELLELQRAQAPSARRFLNITHTRTHANGSYRFAPIRVERDARFRVADEGARGRTVPVVAVALEAPAYPSAARVSAAARYLATRAGIAAFAVLDSHGRLSGVNIRRRFHSASIVKAIMLVAYLRMLDAKRRPLDRASTALLYPMIDESDNRAASAVLAIVGQAALDRVADDAHMNDYERARGWWAFTEVSAADLARFFSVFNSLIPAHFDSYVRSLLARVEPDQSWGIPAVARPEFDVFFKGGWLPESEGLVNQAARLQRPGISFSLAVLTQDNPKTATQPVAIQNNEAMHYGEQTIAGVTERLLGRAP